MDRLDNGFPFVGAEPGCCYAGICDVEDGYGEGLELWCWGDGEVNHLVFTLVRWVYRMERLSTYPSVCEVDDARLALL